MNKNKIELKNVPIGPNHFLKKKINKQFKIGIRGAEIENNSIRYII